MDAEHKSGGGSPFQEECDINRFFTGGGRGTILSEMESALTGQVDIVTLIGEEGSGKTMLCRMLHQRFGQSSKSVFLPQIVESFEDVVRVVAQECGHEYPAETTRADARLIFLDIVTVLRDKGESILLISDEAEDMYLATLERIRKILDDVNEDGGGLKLLFSGRKSFRASFEQLALCHFQEVSEKQFFLSSLGETETWEYLNFCVQELQDDAPQEVFTMEAATKIASMGRGNLRMINVFAEESLKSSSADTSFLVLLDHVADDGAEKELLPASKGVLTRLPFPKKYLAAGGIVGLLFLLVVFFSGGGGDKEITETDDDALVVEEVVMAELPEVVVEEILVEAEDESVPQPELVQEETTRVQRPPVTISPVSIVENSTLELDVPQLTGQSKIALGEETTGIDFQPEESVSAPTPEPVVVPAQIVPVSSVGSYDPSLTSLVVAGEKWLAGQADTNFSIQLMALQSEYAEENLVRIIAEPGYQKVLDKLVMLKRPSNPPIVLVFYGLYPSMAAARNARNNMPIFLRDRHPYPVSVRGAVEKARLH